ncbi:MAG TPA: DNA cytosine methyltransferase [Verrucomicrobiae bacterium]|nr:DNA cytosine methyltransferase [Verrucomicrobiae bacterium]
MGQKKPKVIDFFCGAGGFSEGFRQQGFEIVMGVDKWGLAIETHNLNHNLHDKTMDMQELGSSLDEINKLPDTEVIVGSPPCVLFSHSNKGGNSDKTEGIKLIKAFLRIVAIKKHKSASKLVAWFMENVPNSKNYVQPFYTFRDLDLIDWAGERKLAPDAVALNVGSQSDVVDTADFGTPQKRKRFVCGEIVADEKFPELKSFHVKKHRTVRDVRSKMPAPNLGVSDDFYTDPNYSSLKFKAKNITDHFYDSGVYECQWRDALWLKTNHPYMGRMSFPENEDKPSRTVMATQSASTREALIYDSEYKRKGDGQYRLPTVREVATIMGFPYTYRFVGGENNKWRQIGNAVSPHMSSALAKSVRLAMKLPIIRDAEITFETLDEKEAAKVENLNSFKEEKFDAPPQKNAKAIFRRHPFKAGNMTVALTNFDPENDAKKSERSIEWHTSIFFGAGKDFKVKVIAEDRYKDIGKIIEEQHNLEGQSFISKFEKRFQKTIGCSERFQDAYIGKDKAKAFNPRFLVDEIGQFITENEPQESLTDVPDWISEKAKIPTRQVLTLYAMNRIIS